MFALKQRVAKITRPAVAEPYDGALDAFERGADGALLDEIFAELRAGVVPLLAAIQEKRKIRRRSTRRRSAQGRARVGRGGAGGALARDCDRARLAAADNGRLDVSTHPFTGGAGPEDVRIDEAATIGSRASARTVAAPRAGRRRRRDLGEEGRGLPASVALSMGVHESQSLLWERMVGQSRTYWSWVTPKVHERFPFTKECTAEDFYKAFNE